MVLAAFAAFCFGLSSILVRRGTAQSDRNAGLLISQCMNALGNAVVLLGRWRFGGPLRVGYVGLMYFALGGIFTTFVGRYLWFRSIELIGPSRATSFKNAQPIFTLAVGIGLLHEPFRTVSLAGAALVLGGVWLLSGEQRGEGPGRVVPAGVWWGLACAVSFAAGNIFRKLGVTYWPESTVGACVGSLVAVLGFLTTPPGRAAARSVRRVRWGQGELAFVGVGCLAVVAQQSLFYAYKLAPVWQVNVVTASEPVAVLLLSYLLLRGREVLTKRLVLSVCVVVAGLAVVGAA